MTARYNVYHHHAHHQAVLTRGRPLVNAVQNVQVQCEYNRTFLKRSLPVTCAYNRNSITGNLKSPCYRLCAIKKRTELVITLHTHVSPFI